MTVRVLSVASEAFPLVKTGGLADVVGALPDALKPHGFHVTTLVPGYPEVMQALKKGEIVHHYGDLLGVQARLVGGTASGLDVLALDAPELFARTAGPYSDPHGRDWSDNWLRFAALGRAGADVARGEVAGHGYELLHAHDWQGAMAAAYLYYAKAGVPSVITIHNIAFPGLFPADVFPELRLPPEAFAIEGVEYYGGVGFLKAGLHTADAITTVSPTYAEQICEPAFGMGLEGLIRARRDRVVGIVNGIDTTTWDPSADDQLASIYDATTLELRRENTRAIEKAFGLTESEAPLFCVVSRLTTQKGMDVVAAIADTLADMGVRLALLGTGDAKLETALTAAAARHPETIGGKIGYDEALSHLLQGGSDAILIPSRFEPCGLTQMYGLRYGCVPVAARTGGLADTIVDANEAALAARVATGILFEPVTPGGVLRAVQRAVALFRDHPAWLSLQKQGMKADFSWTHSGLRYAELYRRLLKHGEVRPSSPAPVRAVSH